MKKIYQIWPSRNRFLCGCCITGPRTDLSAIVYIHVCTLIIIIPVCIFIIGPTWNVNPALPLILFLCIISMYMFLYLTACTDPGIIPRRPFLMIDSQKHKKFLYPPTQNATQCTTCHIYRPKRTSHCAYCQNCVQIFDHHCGIIGTCIAKRNYRFFVMFLASVLLTMVMLIVNLIVYFVSKSSGSINQTAIIIVVAIIAGLIGIPILGFFIFHLYLAVTRNTTREVLKHIERDQKEDLQNQWCNVEPSHIDFYQEIPEEQASLIKNQLEQMMRPVVQQNLNNQQPSDILIPT